LSTPRVQNTQNSRFADLWSIIPSTFGIQFIHLKFE
jgi:hypothetical protein